MDIDLLSKMVKELILDKDEVSLPGVGTFVAEMVPSSFSDRGYTINPPYRKLYFRQRVDEADTALVDFYAASNGIDAGQALRILTDFLSEMREVLKQKKTIVFPGLGRLRATRENNFFFVADEDLDIFPAGYGLEPISLKTHQETPEEVSTVVESLKSIMDKKAAENPKPVPVLEPEEPVAEPAAEPEAEPVIEPVAEQPAEPKAEPVIEPVAEQPEEPATEPVAEPVIAEPAEEVPAVAETPVTEEIPAVQKAPAAEEKPAAAEVPVAEEKPAETEVPAKENHERAKSNLMQFGDREKGHVHHHHRKPRRRLALWIFLGILGLLVLLLILFLVLANVAPDFIDSLLYTPEQLEILHY